MIKAESGCWIWNASATHGYGMCRFDGKQQGAHRVSYQITYGSIPAGHLVRHKCDNPACVNPDHLELGSHADNSRDRSERLRAPAKLSPEQVSEVRRLLKAGFTQSEVAAQFGVSRQAIGKIHRAESWKHTPLCCRDQHQ
ncbi:HNH endonuclease [Planctomicrobium sp. SH661]|uniref:HNH endonuclease n=1 Tax=Planctomicrobium sp. SH661 TaxID=3448124 RepID=UPI003F5B5DCF